MKKPFPRLFERLRGWRPPSGRLRIETIDAHAASEPLRVIVAGYPELPGDTMPARRRYAKEHLDHLRRILMLEPRGHADMYGAIVTEPVTEEADFGVLFLHNEGYSTMCGHGIIAVATVAIETGFIPPQGAETPIVIDTPAGLVRAAVRVEEDASRPVRVESVRFLNVPSYVVALDEQVEVPSFGAVRYDLAFGGAYYAFVEASELGLSCEASQAHALIDASRAIKQAVMDARSIEHPFEPDLGFLYGTIFIAPPESASAHSRNVCIFADGELDRSPTGTGVSARAAIHRARGEIAPEEWISIESIVGTSFRVRVREELPFGPHAAIVPEVEGSAFITGRQEFCVDPRDPLRDGFMVR